MSNELTTSELAIIELINAPDDDFITAWETTFSYSYRKLPLKEERLEALQQLPGPELYGLIRQLHMEMFK